MAREELDIRVLGVLWLVKNFQDADWKFLVREEVDIRVLGVLWLVENFQDVDWAFLVRG